MAAEAALKGLPMPATRLADLSSLRKPVVLVNVDTEEEFNWASNFSAEHRSTVAMRQLPVGHGVFRRYGIQPTYLVDHPIITDEVSAAMLRGWVEQGECQVGAQLHPWVNPPHREVVCIQNSYPCNLTPELETEKLTILTGCIAEAIGQAPRIYKAGRYGLDMRREPALARLGYRVDTSVMPYRSYRGAGGGIDFFGQPSQPFWTCDHGELLFLPVTQELVGWLRKIGRLRLGRHLFGRIASRLRVPGVLARLGLLERIMLSPEGASAEEMMRLVDCLIEDGYKVFCLSLHSPTLMPGCTPYTRTQADLDAFVRRLDLILSHMFTRHGAQAMDPLQLLALAQGGKGD